jgi:hypothetical protein
MRTVAQIISDAGGAAAIADASQGAIKKDAVYKWPTIGIQDRHWPLLMSLTEVSAEELFAANQAARQPERAA